MVLIRVLVRFTSRFWTRIRIQSSFGWKICIYTVDSEHRLFVTRRKIRSIGGIEPALVFSCVREPAGVDSWSRPAGHSGQEHGGARRIHGSRSRYLQPWESSGPLLILYFQKESSQSCSRWQNLSEIKFKRGLLSISKPVWKSWICLNVYNHLFDLFFSVRSDTKN